MSRLLGGVVVLLGLGSLGMLGLSGGEGRADLVQVLTAVGMVLIGLALRNRRYG